VSSGDNGIAELAEGTQISAMGHAVTTTMPSQLSHNAKQPTAKCSQKQSSRAPTSFAEQPLGCCFPAFASAQDRASMDSILKVTALSNVQMKLTTAPDQDLASPPRSYA
jgi:hypothetical protein